ncbi:MAG TPA: hypothetical protein VFU02_02700 [Polyangiaceae bacterium]|nr:hypothetical protein [Polyangiaceae bacterium]
MPLGRFRRFLPAFWGIALTQCFPPGEGVEPPASQIYFPVGLALDPDGKSLFVVNSDFDLQYNQGVLQRLDLERVHELVPRSCETDADCGDDKRCDVEPSADNGQTPSYFCVDRSGPWANRPCGALDEAPSYQRVVAPGRCAQIQPSRPQDGGSSLVTASVQIGAFATDAVYRARPADAPSGPAGRLLIPVRGDTTVHYVDVDEEGNFDCGQGNADGRCDDRHRVGDDPDEENTRDQRLPTSPFGIAASDDGRVVTITHQTEGQVSLLINDWSAPPRLEFVLGGLPSRPMELAAVPVPAVAAANPLSYQPGFFVTFRNSAEVRLLRFFDDGLFSDAQSVPARPYLADVGGGRILTNSVGSDSRGIAVDSTARDAAEAECDSVEPALQANCLSEASAVQLDVFVANRTPPSLVVGHTRPTNGITATSDIPTFYRTIPLTAGPSRVFSGSVINADGEPELRVFVVCFDSRLVFIYDPKSDRIEAEIFTGRGPHPLALDAERGVAYIGHFTDSYIGVVALDQRFPRTYGTIVATIGTPTAPRATK